MPPLICLIPAAGTGLRARPSTEHQPKAMLQVAGKPILQHTIELVRDQLDVQSVFVVTGYKGEVIRDYFGTGDKYNVSIQYIDNQELNKGLTWSIYCGKDAITTPFLVLLGDEYYHNSNHRKLKGINISDTLAVCGLMNTNDPMQIYQNYTVEQRGKYITHLHEKPRIVTSNIMGVGTFLLSPRIFHLIGEHYKEKDIPIDFISFLDQMCLNNHTITSCLLRGKYVNVNNVKAFELANQLAGKNTDS